MKKLLQVSLSMLFVFLLLAGPARAATIQLSPADFEHWSAATLERGLYTQEDINSFIDDFCADKAGGSSLLSFLDGSLYYSLHRTADGYGSNGNGKRIGTALESLAATRSSLAAMTAVAVPAPGALTFAGETAFAAVAGGQSDWLPAIQLSGKATVKNLLPTPVPGAAWLLLSGLCGFAVVRRRQK